MLAWAEHHLPRRDDGSGPCLDVFAIEHDAHRQALLHQRGYIHTEMYDTLRRRPLVQAIPDYPVPMGYTVRGMDETNSDRESMAALLNAAFNRTVHSAEEYRNFQTAPHYRADFDIVVEAPDGSLVSTVGFTVHEPESFVLLEPAATRPDHQSKGLVRAAMAEGLRRAVALGIQWAFIGAWHSNPVANHVYPSMGFTDGVRHQLWRLC